MIELDRDDRTARIDVHVKPLLKQLLYLRRARRLPWGDRDTDNGFDTGNHAANNARLRGLPAAPVRIPLLFEQLVHQLWVSGEDLRDVIGSQALDIELERGSARTVRQA